MILLRSLSRQSALQLNIGVRPEDYRGQPRLALRQFVLPGAHLGLSFAMNVAHLGAGRDQGDETYNQQWHCHHDEKNEGEAPRHGHRCAEQGKHQCGNNLKQTDIARSLR